MPGIRTTLAVLLISCACSAQTASTSPVKTVPTTVHQPPLPPSPPDAPILDEGAIPAPNRSTSKLKQVAKRMAPNCLDAVLHTCWSSPPNASPYPSPAARRIVEDMELGDSYMKEKNYRGAKFRFEDALEQDPENSEAIFKLAEVLNKLGDRTEAKEKYEAYLAVMPGGAYAESAQKALHELRP